MQIDAKITIAEQGDVIVILRKTLHGFRNLRDTTSRMLAIITPGGFENFFAEVSSLGDADIARVVEIGKQNDIELVM